MLSTDHIQESMLKRIEQVVATLMAERPFFQEELDYIEIVNHVAKVFQRNLTIEEFTSLSDSDLKKRCSRIMVTEAVAGTLNELTPEQMAIFDEAIKRRFILVNH